MQLLASPVHSTDPKRPLGLNHSQVISEIVLNRLQIIQKYDLWFVRERLLTKELIAPELVDDAIIELRRFFAIFALGHRGMSMISPDVDEAWHAFILFTHQYEDFCNAAFGEFIHHIPDTSRTAPRPLARQEYFAVYEPYFGRPNPLFYRMLSPDEVSCGTQCRGSTNCQPDGGPA